MNFTQLPDTKSYKYILLRLSLLIGAIGWGMSFVFTFTGWNRSVSILQGMGADPITYQPLLDYWLKMASATFGLIGLFFFWCFLRIEKMKHALIPLAIGSIIVGIVLTAAALVNRLNPSQHHTFIADIIFCFMVGVGILYSLIHSD